MSRQAHLQHAQHEQIADPDVDVAETAVTSIEAARLRRELRLLPMLERRVLELRYGLEGRDQHSNRQVAGLLLMSGGRVHYLEQRALELLRGAYGIEAPLLGEAA